MSRLDERIEEAIKNETFTSFEVKGFQSDYTLALRFGIALGYKLATEDFQKLMKESRNVS